MTLDSAIIIEMNAAVAVTSYLDYRAYLGDLYAFLKRRIDKYNYRQFAADLGYSAGTVMHQVVRGHRPLTAKAAKDLATELGLKGDDRKYFLTLVDYCNAKRAPDRDAAFEKLLTLKERTLPGELDKDILEYFSEWYHPVIRELVASKEFKDDPHWIAGRIVPRLRPEQVRQSLDLLQRLNLIRRDAESGRLVQTQDRVNTGHRVRNMAISGYHRAMIEHGRESLVRVPGKRRDISALTVCVDEATAERLKALLRSFQLQLLEEAEKAGAGDQVFQINMQFFPFTE